MFDQQHAMLCEIRKYRPLILNITNAVTMDFIANGLLSLGASPLMSHASCETEELIGMSSAVVINIGTLNDDFLKLAKAACQVANAHHKPIILDPVGAGASHYRTACCLELLTQYNIAVVRGNASEIAALAGTTSCSKGVDSGLLTSDVAHTAQTLARRHDVTVAMSGAMDVIADVSRIETIERGSALMPLITGSGCLLSAVVAAFHAVCAHPFDAALHASLFYALAGERAALETTLPGSFRVHFLDALCQTPTRGEYAAN